MTNDCNSSKIFTEKLKKKKNVFQNVDIIFYFLTKICFKIANKYL